MGFQSAIIPKTKKDKKENKKPNPDCFKVLDIIHE